MRTSAQVLFDPRWTFELHEQPYRPYKPIQILAEYREIVFDAKGRCMFSILAERLATEVVALIGDIQGQRCRSEKPFQDCDLSIVGTEMHLNSK
jgi:hypothetical protein